MKYNVSLDSKELFKLSSDLLKYADDFERKVRIFLERLAESGIKVARANGGIYGNTIVYTTEWGKSEDGITLYMVATGQTKAVEWYTSSTSDKTHSEVINTLLMAEFGSGHYAIKGEGEAAELGGQGTLNVYDHAFDDSWYWWADGSQTDGDLLKTKDGRSLFRSDGVPPGQPLHKAVMACIERVEEIAHEVFG